MWLGLLDIWTNGVNMTSRFRDEIKVGKIVPNAKTAMTTTKERHRTLLLSDISISNMVTQVTILTSKASSLSQETMVVPNNDLPVDTLTEAIKTNKSYTVGWVL
jgi:hypothetical protein